MNAEAPLHNITGVQIDTEVVKYEDIYPYFTEKYLGIPRNVVKRLVMNAILVSDLINKELRTIDMEFSCKPGCCYCCNINVDTFVTEILFLLPLFFSLDEEPNNIALLKKDYSTGNAAMKNYLQKRELILKKVYSEMRKSI